MNAHPDEPTYVLESHAPVVDDPDWTICQFHDPASVGTGGLTVTVSTATLEQLTRGDLAHPLSGADVMALDGH
jgi:hypothetical protein